MRRLLLALMLPASAAMAQDAVHTPTEDCAVIDAVFAGDHLSEPLASGSAGQDCPFPSLPHPPRVVAAGTHGWHNYFHPPQYGADGAHAQIDFASAFNGDNGFFGSHAYHCYLTRQEGRWSLLTCQSGIIAN